VGWSIKFSPILAYTAPARRERSSLQRAATFRYPAPTIEFSLKKKIGAGDHAFPISDCQPLTDRSFKVVLALVGRIDGAKARADGEFSKSGRALFFQAVP
jgi:hypothetical protein